MDDDVVTRNDDLYYPLTSDEKAVLGLFCQHVVNHSPIGPFESSMMCEVPDAYTYFNENGYDHVAVIDLMRQLEKYGYVHIDNQLSPLDALVTNKGWIYWCEWRREYLLEVAADPERAAGWEWSYVLPRLNSTFRRQIEQHLGRRQ